MLFFGLNKNISFSRFEEYDEFQDSNLEQEVKMLALDGIESEWRAVYDVQRATSYYPSYSSWMAYGTSFIGTIIENLQVRPQCWNFQRGRRIFFLAFWKKPKCTQ